MRFSIAVFAGAMAGLVLPLAAGATQDARETTAEPAASKGGGNWPLERVVLTDGKSYQGLVESEGSASIELIEVRRPKGKPMFLVFRTIPRQRIATWERLDSDGQAALRARLAHYRRRALIEGRRMEDVSLSATRQDETLVWHYQGQWFTLESTASEPMTRRSIVRLEQIFAAYRQLLEPRSTTAAHTHIRIFGASEQYRLALAEQGLAIDNPAVFLADKNLILAGSDLNRFDAELTQVNRQHQQIKQQLDALLADTPVRVKQLTEDLKKSQIPSGERQKIVLAEQRKWEDQRKTIRRKIAALDRKNSARFEDVAGQMFRRLAHEAFHAYLETHVYPRRAYDVPRWLNEGLAETFEAGLLEADTLRIDTPNLVALEQLQNDLRGPNPLDLHELLRAGSQTFLAAHVGSRATISRSYYYSWGLAYFLAFEQGGLGTAELDAYLNPGAATTDPIERFEKLVGTPLDEFQTRWRAAMLELKPGM